jgi:hypothetical protein
MYKTNDGSMKKRFSIESDESSVKQKFKREKTRK